MSGWFITSSGTGIGKTLVACALIRCLRRRGIKVRAVKPVITGYSSETAADSDSGRLLAALELALSDDNIAAVSPWRLSAPLSPDMAATREGQVLDVNAIAAFCRDGAEDDSVLLVEGIGGVMVPLNDNATVLDLMVALGYPAILVVGSYLGTLSHSLTAAAALAADEIDIAAVVVSESAESPVPSRETADTLARYLHPAPVMVLPRGGAADDAPETAAALIAALGLEGAP